MRWLCALSALVLICAIGCGGDGGGGCSMPGSSAECSSGDICSNLSGDGNACRKICTAQADCAADESCLGVANTNIKSCQPKSASAATATTAPTVFRRWSEFHREALGFTPSWAC
jgi:hypothetical protein